MSSDSVIDRIDLGLKTYYEKLGRKDYVKEDGVGKFKFFVEECGFDDDSIEDELKQEPDECTIVAFDWDDNFPLKEEIEDEDAKNEEIHRILNDIAKYGAPREEFDMGDFLRSIGKFILPTEILRDEEKVSDSYEHQQIRSKIADNNNKNTKLYKINKRPKDDISDDDNE
eukprot:106555_1